MKTETVRMRVRRTKGIQSVATVSVIVESCTSEHDTIRKAQLTWLNDYINRKDQYPYINELNKAKAKAGIEILESKIIKDHE